MTSKFRSPFRFVPYILLGILLFGGVIFQLVASNASKFSTGSSQLEQPVQSHTSYVIDVTQKPDPGQIELNKPVTIAYKITNQEGEVIKDFAVTHEKLMHFIIVRKDLTQFQHLHPIFDASTGEFKTEVTFTVDGPYRFFADFMPGASKNHMQLPVTLESDIDVGEVSHFQPHALNPDTKTSVTVPPNYQVNYGFPASLKSKEALEYSLTITQNNKPVTLEKYLGALGHSVILQEGTLAYIHTHAGEAGHMGHAGHDMGSVQEDNTITFTTTFPEPGNYKIFTQFQHEGKVSTTEYSVAVN